DDYLLSLCSGDQYSIVATPALNQYGTATISVTITDGGGLASSTSFNLTVTDVDESIYMWENFQAAESVLGQSDFSSNATGTSDSLMDHPAHVVVDPTSGKVFVSELDNNRILRFSAAASLVNGSAAEAVFGQANFVSGQANRGGSVSANTLNSPTGINVDSFGSLWVADYLNNRVLRFDNASSKTTGANADAVLGQSNFNSNSNGTTQNSMNRPIGVWVDFAGNLWVDDYLNNRILRFNDAARKSNGANADAVLGQTNYTTAASGTTQSTFSNPISLFGDNNNTIFVSDQGNQRILRFDNATLKANGANADGVLGQTNFTSNISNTTANGLYKPVNPVLDNAGHLYISESLNYRILIYKDAVNKANGASADYVLGQPNFTSNTADNGGLSERSLNRPQSIFFDNINNYLWVTDWVHDRVLRYAMKTKTPPVMGVINDSTMDEDTVSNSISFTATDINEQALTITYTSSDISLISSSGITFSGDQISSSGGVYTVTTSSGTSSVTLSITPVSNQSGTCSITITVTDPDGMTSSEAFNLTIDPVNDPPQIGSIADQTTLEDISTSIISLTATDLETASSSLILTMTSSNQILVPDEYLLYLSNSGQYSIVATPALNQYGTATISVTITDGGGLAASTLFNLTVTDVDDSVYMWANFQAAESVLGQTNFSSDTTGTTDSLMNHPAHVAVDPTSGKVFVSDLINCRILRFSAAASLANGSAAEAVFGQANFVSGQANRGGSVAANTLYNPSGIHVDSFGSLWVADYLNNRVLRFDNASSKTTGANADAVLGQSNFISNSSGTTQNSMNRPIGVWVDFAGNLWVTEYSNNRILRFNDAARKANGANADAVLGQTNYTTATSGTTQSTFSGPTFLFSNNNDTIFVTDFSNNRILRFDNATLKVNGANADGVLGQANFTSSVSNITSDGINSPENAVLGNAGHLYISDGVNRRVLIYKDAINKANGASADYVLGQPDFTSNTINNGGITEKSLGRAHYIFFDNINNYLWVTDFGNVRVLRYAMMTKAPPVMGVINDSTMDEDTVSTAISFTVTDIDEQALTITYISSDASIISSSGITFSGSQVSTNGSSYTVSTTAVDTTVTLTVTPETNQSGTAFITITVTDPDGMTATDSFNLTVTSVDDPPVLSIIPSIGTAAGEISFTFVEADGDTVSLTVTSSDQSLISDSNIRIVGVSGNSASLTTISDVAQSVSIQLTQESNVHGLVTLTVTASTVGGSVTESFNVIVSPPGSGNALEFDGSNDYVNLGNSTALKPTSALTYEIWLYHSNWQNCDANVLSNTDSSGYAFGIKPQYVQLFAYINGSYRNASFSRESITPGWHHFALTFDGKYVKSYLDGEQKAEIDLGSSTYTISYISNSTIIGGEAGAGSTPTGRYFDGKVDELRVWNVGRTSEQIKSNMCKKLTGGETGLIAYYRFDHSSGTTLVDLTGNGNDGIVNNMTDSDWTTSGAALGDNSTYDYTGAVASDFSVSLSHSDGDAFTAFGDSGTYTGLHLYLVNEAPSSYTAPAGFSTLYTDHYFGVFPVGITPTYSISYNYTENTSIATETGLRLASRNNNSGTWIDSMTNVNTSSTTLSKTGIATSSGISSAEFIPGSNATPVLGSVIDQTINEDSTLSSVPITVTDTETAGCSLGITFVSSDTSLIPVENISYTCSAGIFYLS
ncbi:hypothetical protein MHK_005218, partial [Candidatus Magnetomorum sp. HK-1]